MNAHMSLAGSVTFFFIKPGAKKMLQNVLLDDFLKLKTPVLSNPSFELCNFSGMGYMSAGMTANVYEMIKNLFTIPPKKPGAKN